MSPGHHAATFDDALRWLSFFLGWDTASRWMELRLWRPEHEGRMWHQAGRELEELVRLVRETDERWSNEVLLGVPATARRSGGVRTATAFWAVTDSPDAVARLERFRPLPSLVLRAGSGSVRVAVWPLVHPVSWRGITRGNRNLAHFLRTAKKYCEPENLWIPAPGTCLRRGRARPAPVVVERLELDAFEPLQVIGARQVDGRRYPVLKEAPDPDAWLKQQRQGR